MLLSYEHEMEVDTMSYNRNICSGHVTYASSYKHYSFMKWSENEIRIQNTATITVMS